MSHVPVSARLTTYQYAPTAVPPASARSRKFLSAGKVYEADVVLILNDKHRAVARHPAVGQAMAAEVAGAAEPTAETADETAAE